MLFKLRRRQKKFVYTAITIGLLMIVMELLARGYYYQQASRKIPQVKVHPVALVQLTIDVYRVTRRHADLKDQKKKFEGNKNQYKVRPDKPKQENDLIASENVNANKIIYHPWLQFTYNDFRGKYVNIHNQIRKSVPDVSDSSANDNFTVYFLGGSTMYGYNVADSETIPAYFIEAYKKRFPSGKPVKVVNLGVPFYFSYQELMLLADKIFRQDIPDMVIMLDGLNDCIQKTASWWRMPFFTTKFQRLINPELSLYPDVIDYYHSPDGIKSDSVNKQIFNYYINTINNVNNLAKQYRFQLYCFWQPVPFYQYPNRDNDPFCSKKDRTDFNYIYPMVEKKAKELDYLFFLGNLLQKEKGVPFIDGFHYTPAFNKTIAEKMAESIPFEQ